eukprot:TRINITY_DN76532_c0_g1_i1.p1 TRINITY_DN76532_c0_g1~~TRINITY_DN76532_c0_g1_i1.p1  ORF type:complete len:151 (+),score=44.28 TRINITY_DN76532_c0_g1_i1:59-511(+)
MALPCSVRLLLLCLAAHASSFRHVKKARVGETKTSEKNSTMDVSTTETRGCDYEYKAVCKVWGCKWVDGICYSKDELAGKQRREEEEKEKRRQEAAKEAKRRERAKEREQECEELKARYLKKTGRKEIFNGDYHDGFKKFAGGSSGPCMF